MTALNMKLSARLEYKAKQFMYVGLKVYLTTIGLHRRESKTKQLLRTDTLIVIKTFFLKPHNINIPNKTS